MEFVMTAILFILVFAMGWTSGCIHAYNREIDILNGFRQRVEDIEAKYIEDQKKLKEQVEHDEN